MDESKRVVRCHVRALEKLRRQREHTKEGGRQWCDCGLNELQG